MLCRGAKAGEDHSIKPMSLHNCKLVRSTHSWAKYFLAFVMLSGALALWAQEGPDLPDRPDRGVSAGGNWTESRSEDRMTAAKRVRFDLVADNTGDGDDQARVILFCTDGKLKLADFRPNIRLARPDWPGFWGQPQMRVRVRVDDSHSDHSWNWVHGHFLSMDKGTARELIGAHLFRVEFRTPEGPRIAEFSPAGLDLNRVRNACDLTPKKP
jgi:hypothetical protein